jgi:hypothetical protein
MSTEELPRSIDPMVTAPMAETEPQTAGGKVLWHFTMSLDGFVAGPNHTMDWMTGISSRPRSCRGVRRDDRRGAGRSGRL